MNENANQLDNFLDVRTIQRNLKEKGISLEKAADENTSGPESLVLLDPDGKPLRIGQYV